MLPPHLPANRKIANGTPRPLRPCAQSQGCKRRPRRAGSSSRGRSSVSRSKPIVDDRPDAQGEGRGHAERRRRRSALWRGAGAAWSVAGGADRRGCCVLGRNGVGKTSLLRGVVGHQRISPAVSSGTARISAGLPRTSAHAAASPSCRRAARSFRCSRSRRTWRPALRC